MMALAAAPAPGSPFSVVVEGLRVTRSGREILHPLSFAVPAGSVTGVLGPSGAGKTTLLRVILGIQRMAAGSVTVLGQPAGAPGLRRRVGYAPQAPAIYADLTIRQNLSYFGAVLGVPSSDTARVIQQVGLTGVQNQLGSELSGGQRSRASLAVALLGRPELLVLDEPTVSADPVLRRELWALFNELAGGGATLLISSHVMDEAARCERLLLLRDGRILADDTREAVQRRTGERDLERAFLWLVDRSEDADR